MRGVEQVLSCVSIEMQIWCIPVLKMGQIQR